MAGKWTGRSCRLGRLARGAGLAIWLLWPATSTAQIRGIVVDSTGRALPLVTVISRTNNGFLASRTDLDGRFAFPGRPHRPGHFIDAMSAGFVPSRHVVAAGDTVVTLVMTPDPASTPLGWESGLAVLTEMSVLREDGSGVTDAVPAGAPVEVVIVTRDGGTCAQFGAPVTRAGDGRLRIAVPQFVRGGACEPGPAGEIRIPARAPSATVWEIRVVGRYGDLVRRIPVEGR